MSASQVQLDIHRAFDLVGRDVATKTSNVLATVTIGGESFSTSPVKPSTTHPEWVDQHFTFPSATIPCNLQINVYHKDADMGTESLLGAATLVLFDRSTEMKKNVLLNHGGNRDLAAMALQGCGSIEVSYTVSAAAPPAAAAETLPPWMQQPTAAPVVASAPVVPAPTPAAVTPAAAVTSGPYAAATPNVATPAPATPYSTPAVAPYAGAPAAATPVVGAVGAVGTAQHAGGVPQPAATQPSGIQPTPQPAQTQVPSFLAQNPTPAPTSSVPAFLQNTPVTTTSPAPLAQPSPAVSGVAPTGDATQPIQAGAQPIPAPMTAVPLAGPIAPLGGMPAAATTPGFTAGPAATGPAGPLVSQPAATLPATGVPPTTSALPLGATGSTPTTSATYTPAPMGAQPSGSVPSVQAASQPGSLGGSVYSPAAQVQQNPVQTPGVGVQGVPPATGPIGALGEATSVPTAVVGPNATTATALYPGVAPPAAGVVNPVQAQPSAQDSANPSGAVSSQPPGVLASTQPSGVVSHPVVSQPSGVLSAQPSGAVEAKPASPVTATPTPSIPKPRPEEPKPELPKDEGPLFKKAPPAPPKGTAPVVIVAPGSCVPSRPTTAEQQAATSNNENKDPTASKTATSKRLGSSKATTTKAGSKSQVAKKGTHTDPSSPELPNSSVAASARKIRNMYKDVDGLLSAALQGHPAKFEQLREADPLLTHGFQDLTDYCGRTPLHLAAWHGHMGVLEAILKPIMDGSSSRRPLFKFEALTSESGNTVLHSAAMGGDIHVVAWLLQNARGIEVNVQAVNRRGLTPMQAAREVGNQAVADLLVRYEPTHLRPAMF